MLLGLCFEASLLDQLVQSGYVFGALLFVVNVEQPLGAFAELRRQGFPVLLLLVAVVAGKQHDRLLQAGLMTTGAGDQTTGGSTGGGGGVSDSTGGAAALPAYSPPLQPAKVA